MPQPASYFSVQLEVSFLQGFTATRAALLFVWLGRFFTRREHPPNNWRIELIKLLTYAAVILHAKPKRAQVSFFFKILAPQRDRQHPVQAAFAICGFISMTTHIRLQ